MIHKNYYLVVKHLSARRADTRACYMRGSAEQRWHTGANYILDLDERAHLQYKQADFLFSAQHGGYRSAAFMLPLLAICVHAPS